MAGTGVCAIMMSLPIYVLLGIASPYNAMRQHRSPATTAAVNNQTLPSLVSHAFPIIDQAGFEEEIGIPVNEVRSSDRNTDMPNTPLAVRKTGSEAQLLPTSGSDTASTQVTTDTAVRPVLRSASRICVMLLHVL